MGLKFYTQKNAWRQSFLPEKILGTSILIYSITQTLKPKKKIRELLTQKKYQGCKFSTPKKYVGPPRHVYCKYLLGPPLLNPPVPIYAPG